MVTQNVFMVNGEHKTLLAENALVLKTKNDVVTLVPMNKWKQFISPKSIEYTDNDVNYCLAHGLVPGQIWLESNNLVFEEYIEE